MAISLGVHVGQQNMSMDVLRNLWRNLDARGVDWISAWDHLYEAPPNGGTQPHFEALTTLAALACETKHARIGCLVFYVGYRNPALLAKAATTLDHLSNGRFELGLGAGWHIWEASAHGFVFPDIGTRLDMLEEGVQIIRQMLTQDRTTFSGKHFQVDDVSCLPAPVQQRLPIWIGGTGEKRTLQLAAQHADGWNAAYLAPTEYARLNKVLDVWCDEFDRDPRTIRRGVNLLFNMSASASEVGKSEQSLVDQWGAAAPEMREGALLGTPEQVTERLLAYAEAGAQEINIALRAPFSQAALDAYLEEVMPAVRRALG
jgi:alkanesulfonate monooxygenase SsuD/methylene tetrahydromethanopterin reductase-like flavin-dependent oxidoreductase (luciferase family)